MCVTCTQRIIRCVERTHGHNVFIEKLLVSSFVYSLPPRTNFSQKNSPPSSFLFTECHLSYLSYTMSFFVPKNTCRCLAFSNFFVLQNSVTAVEHHCAQTRVRILFDVSIIIFCKFNLETRNLGFSYRNHTRVNCSDTETLLHITSSSFRQNCRDFPNFYECKCQCVSLLSPVTPAGKE